MSEQEATHEIISLFFVLSLVFFVVSGAKAELIP